MDLKRFLGHFAKTYLAIGALSVSAYAGADDHYNSYNCAPSSAPSCVSSCCGVPCNEPPICAWGYNPPAYSKCGNDTNCGGFLDTFSFRADFLWWRASEEGLQLGTQEELDTFSPSALTATVVNTSRTRKPDFKYDPGFRIGISNCACDGWDMALNWIHFHTKANASGATIPVIGGGTSTFISDWERLVDANPLTASGRYTLNLDLVDIEFGRKFYVSSSFILRPQFGLRIARIDQNYRVESAAIGATAPITDFTAVARSRSDFTAVGPRVGLDIELNLGCGIALFGQGAGSILFGRFDNHSRELLTNFTDGATVGSFEYEARSSSNRCSRTTTDLAFGVKWEHCYEWCNRMHPVALAFAWEHHGFYDLNSFNFVERGYNLTTGAFTPGSRKHGDLYTQGLTVSLGFGF